MACMSPNSPAYRRAWWRAHEILSELEAQDRRAPIEKMIDDLPLFSHRPPPQERKDPLREAITAIEPDTLTPREALALLYELKERAKS